MKRVVLFILSVFLLLNFSACTKQNSIVTEDCDNQKGCDISEGGEEIKTLDFKESYESLNNHETKSGKIYREIHLDNTNSFPILGVVIINTLYSSVSANLLKCSHSVLQ